jgi:predicted Rossmann fold nucleotide-binding protein DprA/Smf involved in DNA uptake
VSALTQDSLAILALTYRLQPSDVSPLKASELWSLLEKVPEVSSLVGLDSRSISELIGATSEEAERLGRLLDSGVGLAVKLDSLLETGIVPLTALDHRYPHRLRQRLGGAAPPVLFCAGELSLLEADGFGVVGSRDVGPEAADIARSIARVIVSARLPVVSGGAKGVDKISMAAAFDAGGQAIGVLADSLEQAISRSDNRRALLDGHACLCTPYSPAARFTAGNAMGRNKIIYGLSRLTVVVASSHGEGGTWAGATEAIRKRYGRVAVWVGDGAGPGNFPLVEAGAAPIDRADAILDVEERDPRPARPAQMALTFNGVVESEAPRQTLDVHEAESEQQL